MAGFYKFFGVRSPFDPANALVTSANPLFTPLVLAYIRLSIGACILGCTVWSVLFTGGNWVLKCVSHSAYLLFLVYYLSAGLNGLIFAARAPRRWLYQDAMTPSSSLGSDSVVGSKQPQPPLEPSQEQVQTKEQSPRQRPSESVPEEIATSSIKPVARKGASHRNDGRRRYPLQRSARLLQAMHMILLAAVQTFPLYLTCLFTLSLFLVSSRAYESLRVGFQNIMAYIIFTSFAVFELLFTNTPPPLKQFYLPCTMVLVLYVFFAHIMGYYPYDFFRSSRTFIWLSWFFLSNAFLYVNVFFSVRRIVHHRGWPKVKRNKSNGALTEEVHAVRQTEDNSGEDTQPLLGNVDPKSS